VITRREFVALLAAAPRLRAANSIENALRESIERNRVPALTAMVATPDRILYTGAFGEGVKPDSLFHIASMTKAVTTVAALQLVEQGKVKIDAPVGTYLPALRKLEVFHGWDAAGKAILRPVAKPVTLHHLLTHTSGFAYDTWDKDAADYVAHNGPNPNGFPPLMFEPGSRWQYGTGVDWAGRLVEHVSGLNLEQYCQKHILQPLGMKDTSFIVSPAAFERHVTNWQHAPDGAWAADERKPPAPPTSYNGGGGLHSNAGDYVRFMQMILQRGGKILQPKTIELMTRNQIGSLSAGKLHSLKPAVSADVDFHPGATDGFTCGFLYNHTAYPGGRSAGSLAWAGLYNTFYWIDPHRSLCAVIMMQFLPFVDKAAMDVLSAFERAVYAST